MVKQDTERKGWLPPAVKDRLGVLIAIVAMALLLWIFVAESIH